MLQEYMNLAVAEPTVPFPFAAVAPSSESAAYFRAD